MFEGLICLGQDLAVGVPGVELKLLLPWQMICIFVITPDCESTMDIMCFYPWQEHIFVFSVHLNAVFDALL